jgi:hypothetical protein
MEKLNVNIFFESGVKEIAVCFLGKIINYKNIEKNLLGKKAGSSGTSYLRSFKD